MRVEMIEIERLIPYARNARTHSDDQVAQRTGRVCRSVEIAPEYVDVAVRRWQQFTGKTATLESTGEPFPG